MDARALAQAFFDEPSRAFAVRLWDGTLLEAPRPTIAAGEVQLRDPDVALDLLPPASERRLAEAFIDGSIEFHGDAIGLLEAVGTWQGPQRSRALAAVLGHALPAIGRRLIPRRSTELMARLRGLSHARVRDGQAVRFHYDLSDEFYRLFLDEQMVYSCGYFPTGSESLDQAQRDKLELVCRKLGLRQGERLLDIGCGWGALLEHAAREHGARGLGVTLSNNQLAAAGQRRLPGVEVRAADYRDLREPPFDKIASVGMMEHVGRAQLDAYFRSARALLREGGLFLNHAIADVQADRNTVPWLSRSDGSFLGSYIFPDYDLVPIAQVVAAAERAGFEVRDIESLREHYAETLTRWLRRFEQRTDDAARLVGVARTRAFRLYLASSAAAFRLGRISVFQLLLANRTRTGRAPGLPRCRATWYQPAAPVAH
jgi:cyclopropane-fatty-acyl-phospholipid synthase